MDGFFKSGKRDSNPRPSAWEADALPTELFPQLNYVWPDKVYKFMKIEETDFSMLITLAKVVKYCLCFSIHNKNISL
jgi:hypothetical protein